MKNHRLILASLFGVSILLVLVDIVWIVSQAGFPPMTSLWAIPVYLLFLIVLYFSRSNIAKKEYTVWCIISIVYGVALLYLIKNLHI
jgi:hypothetical protein